MIANKMEKIFYMFDFLCILVDSEGFETTSINLTPIKFQIRAFCESSRTKRKKYIFWGRGGVFSLDPLFNG